MDVCPIAPVRARRRSSADPQLAMDVVHGAETCVRVGACTRSPARSVVTPSIRLSSRRGDFASIAGQVVPGTAFDPDNIAELFWTAHTDPTDAWQTEHRFHRRVTGPRHRDTTDRDPHGLGSGRTGAPSGNPWVRFRHDRGGGDSRLTFRRRVTRARLLPVARATTRSGRSAGRGRASRGQAARRVA